MKIGGMFELEKCKAGNEKEKPNTIYAMSGRCALYACLKDIKDDVKKVAYVPAYTCETVLGSYLKAGFSLRFYDIAPDNLTPIYKEEDLDGVGVFGLCAYYGFIRYDQDFLKIVHDRGIIIVHDTTHSPLYTDPMADYSAGSLRKWMGIASGGVAYKKAGEFNIELMPPEAEHIKGRYKAMEERFIAIKSGDDEYNKKASETFWETELRLRKIFDAYKSDDESTFIAKNFDYDAMAKKRRENFMAIISSLEPAYGWRPIFTELKEHDVPSHFSLYADSRDELQSFLRERGISSTVYWPLPPMIDDIKKYPGAMYIYSHICSIQLDQRYDEDAMKYLASVLNEYSAKNKPA